MTKGLEILNEYFDKIYVITLKRAVDRQEKINHHFANIDFEYFYGIDRLNLDMQQLIETNVYDPVKAKKSHRHSKGMPIGHIACSLSHRELYKKILAEGYQKVLIMEDDFVPTNINPAVIGDIFKELPANWELVYLGYYLNENTTFWMRLKQAYYMVLSFFRLIKWTPKQVSNLYPKKYSTHLQKAGFHDALHSYAVTAPCLPKLIEAQTPVIYNADPLVTSVILDGKINAFITMPKIFDQEKFMEEGSKASFITD